MKRMELKLCDAARNGDLEEIKRLVEKGGIAVTWALHQAVHWGCWGVIKYLVEKGAVVTSRDDYAIRAAVGNGQFEVVKYLISVGAGVNANYGWAIARASRYNRLDTIKFILQLCKNRDIKTPYEEIFRYLTNEHIDYFKSIKAFRRWRMVVFRRFFRKTVIPLYYSPGFPGGIRVKRELEAVCRKDSS